MNEKSNTRITLEHLIELLTIMIHSREFLINSRMRSEYFTRNRKMPFSKLVLCMLNMVKSSIKTHLEEFFEYVTKENEDMTQQSFSEARKKIRYTAFPKLFAYEVDAIYNHHYDTWNGYRLSAIDGSKMQLPDEEKLRAHFGTMGSDNTAAMAQASALYDVLNNVLIDVRMAPLRIDERTLAVRHIETLCSCPSFNKECILFDRGYASFDLIKTLKGCGIFFVMRAKRGFSKTIDQLSNGDHHTVILKKSGNDDILVRVLKFNLSSGEEETLITDIVDKNLNTEDFKKLYFMRWPIETKYDEIKNKLQIENFSGRTVKTVLQDFYITMFISNVLSVACWEAQPILDEGMKNKDNKYDYHINVNHAIGVFRDRFIRAMLETNQLKRANEVRRILFLLTKNPTPTRPERSRPRNKSPRCAKFRHNKKSSC